LPIRSVNTAAPSKDLVTLTTLKAEMKGELGGVTEADEAVLQRHITAASLSIERFTQRFLPFEEGIEEHAAGFGDNVLQLERRPITTLTTILQDSSPVTNVVVHDADAGQLYREDGFVWSAPHWWASSRSRIAGQETPEFVVTYDAGYVLPSYVGLAKPASLGGGTWAAGDVTLPEDIQQAALILAAYLFRKRLRPGDVSQERIGDYAVTYRSGMPGEAAAILDSWVESF
jgi:hypothetical protein